VGLLDGKVAIITGAAHGLGRQYAELFAVEGASVVVNDLGVSVNGLAPSSADAEEVAAAICSAGGQAVASAADVSDPVAAAGILDDAVSQFGSVDILVNNAGIVRDRAFTEMSHSEWTSVLAVHLTGTKNVTQPVFDHMVKQRRGGVIVNTTSRSGLRGKIDQANYSAAKGGIVGLSNVLALEGAAHGIRVWTISPRAATRAWASVASTSAGPMTDLLWDRFPIDAVATTVLYMVSDLSAPHTGKVVFASAESIREVRWEAAAKYSPGTNPTVAELQAAIASGQLLFKDEADPERLW
jgi:NAD(P)-dependent dehydrogenase (short-subunit alcohol dehydrogenase family)